MLLHQSILRQRRPHVAGPFGDLRAELIIGIPSSGGTTATIKVPYEIVATTP